MKTRTSLILCAVAVLAFVAVRPAQAVTYTWSVGTENWDTTTANWTGTTWVNGHDAVFGGTAGSTITINVAGITANKLTFNVDGDTIAASGANDLTLAGNQIYVTSGKTATISAPIAGTSGGLELYNGGTLILSGANTYTGNMYIGTGGGTIQSGHDDAFGGAVWTMGWGGDNVDCTFDLNGFDDTATAITFGDRTGGTQVIETGAGTLTINGKIEGKHWSRGVKSISGNLKLGTTGTTEFSNHGDYPLIIPANITGVAGAGIKITGNSVTSSGVVLSGVNTFDGDVTLETGVVRIGVDPAGTVAVPVSSALGIGTLRFDNGGISSDGTTARDILNPASFTSDRKAYLGDAVKNGTLTFKAPIDLGGSNCNFYFNSPVVFEGGFTGTGTFIKRGSLDYTLSSSLGVNIGVGEGNLITAGDNIINGKVLRFLEGKTYGSTLVLGGDDTVNQIYSYKGGAIDGAGHTLTFTNAPPEGKSIDTREGPMSISADLNLGGGIRTFVAGWRDTEQLAISGDITGDAASGIVITSGYTDISGDISGDIPITNSGSGILTLSGTNTYTGATNITNGGLFLANTAAKAPASAISISGGKMLALAVGGAGEFTAADFDSILAHPATMANVTMAANSIAGVDTSAGSITLAGGLTTAKGITKFGGNTLTLNGNNAISGAINVYGGSLELTGDNSGSTSEVHMRVGADTLRVTGANSLPTGRVYPWSGTTVELSNVVPTTFAVGPNSIQSDYGDSWTLKVTGASHTLTSMRGTSSCSQTITGDPGVSLRINSYDSISDDNFTSFIDVDIDAYIARRGRLNPASGTTITLGGTTTAQWHYFSMNGAGTLILDDAGGAGTGVHTLKTDSDGDWNFTNGLTIVKGTVASTGAGTRKFNVNNGTVSGTGAINVAAQVDGKGSINLADGVAQANLVFGNTLKFNNSTKKPLVFDLGATSGGTDTFSVTGAITITHAGAPLINFNQIGGVATAIDPGTYTLIDTDGAAPLAASFGLGTAKAFGREFALADGAGADLNDVQVVVTAGHVGLASPAWTGATDNLWTDTGNWVGGADIPGYESNVSIYDTAANLSTVLNDDFDINSLNYETNAISPTTIAKGTGGMLIIEADSANGITVNTPTSGTPTHTISANVGLASDQTWTVESGARLKVSGVISDVGLARTLTKDGDGVLELAQKNATSGIVINGGTVLLSKQGALQDTVTVNAGATLDSLIDNSFAWEGWITSVNINGGTIGGSDRGQHFWNTFTVNMTGGQLILGGGYDKNEFSDPTFNISASATTAQILGRDGDESLDIRTGSAKFNVADGAQDVDLLVDVIVKGDGGQTVTKNGAGTMSFTKPGTYTGTTAINGGTLLVNNTTGSATGTSTVTVASGATLGGTGAIGGATTVNSGGTLSPGASPGILTVNNDLTFADGGNTWVAELLGTDDRVNVTGTLTLGDATTLEFPFDGANPFEAGTYTLADCGTLTDGTTFSSVTNLGAYTPGVVYDYVNDDITIEVEAGLLAGDANLDRTVDLDDFARLRNNYGTGDTWAEADFNGDDTVNLDDFAILRNNYGSHVPEPATLAILAMGGAWLAFRRRRHGTKGTSVKSALKKMAGGLVAAVLALVVAAGACQAAMIMEIQIDVSTGQAYIFNPSATPGEWASLTGYAITSAGGYLLPANPTLPVGVGEWADSWLSLGDQTNPSMPNPGGTPPTVANPYYDAAMAIVAGAWALPELSELPTDLSGGTLAAGMWLDGGGSVYIGKVVAPPGGWVVGRYGPGPNTPHSDLAFRILEDGATASEASYVNLVPEPATLALLGLGGLATLIRRRKRR